MKILEKRKPAPSDINVVKDSIVNDAQGSFRQLFRCYKHGVENVWLHPRLTPKEIVEALNKEKLAVEVFQLHGKLGEVLEELQPGCTEDLKEHIGDFTINIKTVTVHEEDDD